MKKCKNCGIQSGWINGKTLRGALHVNNVPNRFGKIGQTSRVNICPRCDALALGIASGQKWPFFTHDGVAVTLSDYDQAWRLAIGEELEFCDFRFSRSALENSLTLVAREDPDTDNLEKIGTKVTGKEHPVRIINFSKQVFSWGRVQRAWGNVLQRNDRKTLGRSLKRWFRSVRSKGDVEEILSEGLQIQGFGVSVASKHLRMLDPARFAVLDSVMTSGIGIAANQRGYRYFLRRLIEFRGQNSLRSDIGTIESGIFGLVRQDVRSRYG